jgi:hypothetical protein
MSKVKENTKVLDVYSKYTEDCVEYVDEEDEREVLGSLGLTKQKFNDFDESCTDFCD